MGALVLPGLEAGCATDMMNPLCKTSCLYCCPLQAHLVRRLLQARQYCAAIKAMSMALRVKGFE